MRLCLLIPFLVGALLNPGTARLALAQDALRPTSQEVIHNDRFELPPPARDGNLRIGTWNIRNFSFDERPPDPTIGYLRQSNPVDIENILVGLGFDLLAVQEIRDGNWLEYLLLNVNRRTGRLYALHLSESGGQHDQKLGVIVDHRRLRVDWTRESQAVNITGGLRPVYFAGIASIEPGGADFVVGVVHLKSIPVGYDTRRRQVAELLKILTAWEEFRTEEDVILLGDFNTTGRRGQTCADEIAVLDEELKPEGFRRLVSPLACSEYWDGPKTGDGIQIPSLLDLVYLRSFQEHDNGVALLPYLHCKRMDCGELISAPGREDPTYWDVSDHCPLLFEIRNVNLDD